jgi:hypothetical protein
LASSSFSYFPPLEEEREKREKKRERERLSKTDPPPIFTNDAVENI